MDEWVYTLRDIFQNEDNKNSLGIINIEEKIKENRSI